jgi:hypothetical protein
VTGCSLEYSFVNLNSQCAAIRVQVYETQMGVLLSTLDRVGRFGNSEVTNPTDWVPIIKSIPDRLTGKPVCSSFQMPMFFSGRIDF